MKTLHNFKKFIDELNKDNSRNYKTAVLEAHKDDEDIKYYLDFIFNPFIITGISNKKLNRKVETDYSTELLTIIDILNYAKTHNTGSDKDLSIIFSNRDTLFEYFNLNVFLDEAVNEQQFGDIIASLYDLFDKILVKNLQLGIDAKTINKVIPNLIPTFNVQLAQKYFDRPEYIEGKKFVVTTKIDGMRCIMLKENGKATFWSRQGQPIEGLVDLIDEAEKHIPDGIMLDGELIAKESIVEEAYKTTMKRARTKDQEKHGLKMLVFDTMPVENFKKQYCEIPYQTRRALMSNILAVADFVDGSFGAGPGNKHVFEYFEILPVLYKGTDTSKVLELLEEQTAKGEEGIMINVWGSLYEFTRTWNLLKVKHMQTLDLEVIGMEEGTNSNQGTLGALLVRYKDGNVVKVGSGYSKELRADIWNNKEEWLNAIIEVQYFEETENANGGKSIRFPVFKDRRTDKDIPDY